MMDQSILHSPEEELKLISLDENVGKNVFGSPKIIEKFNGKFTFESWNIPQKLRSLKTIDYHYQTAFSSYYTPSSSQRNNLRTKSAFLSQQHDINQHNFSNRKKYPIEPNTHRKSLSFFNASKVSATQKSTILIPQQNQPKQNKIIFMSKSKLETMINQGRNKNQKNKKIENYLINQKKIINRQKSLTHNQRIERERLSFLVYPTQYWQGVKLNSPKKKYYFEDKKNLSFFSISPSGNIKSSTKSKESSMSKSTSSKSPKKRFNLFVSNLQKVSNK